MQIAFQRAIATLPEKQQLVFKMKYFEELKYEEISEIFAHSRCFEGIIPSCGKKIELIITTG
jgi:RNA polymerase sigma-70 factor (ECF subfamily)